MTIVASLPPTHTCTYTHTYWQELSSLPLQELLVSILEVKANCTKERKVCVDKNEL